jgi:phospholipid transport system transporter-binding protein
MFSLPATLTHAQAAPLQKQLADLVKGAQTSVQIDASALTQFDSSALAVLLDCRRHAQATGKNMLLHGAPERLQTLAAIYGVEGLLFSVSQ